MVAGEASGDNLGAGLISQLKQIYPDALFQGIGGDRMQAAGLEAWHHSNELAVMGLFEVLKHVPRLLRLRRGLMQRLLDQPPDVYIGIDAPDFNLGVETRLKARGIATVHYVSPTVWAWRAGRVKKIARAADLLLTLFPFEPKYYDGQPMNAEFVGHPMADSINGQNDPATARQSLGLDPQAPVVTLLPGSRGGEVSRLAEPLLQAAMRLQTDRPLLQFFAAFANPGTQAVFEQQRKSLAPQLQVGYGLQNARTAMAAADVVVCASGTATLETMLVNRPMVVVYKLSPATHWLAKTFNLVKTRHVSLPNILAEAELLPELLQENATPQNIAAAIADWLDHPDKTLALKQRFSELAGTLKCNADVQAAAAVHRLLQHRSQS